MVRETEKCAIEPQIVCLNRIIVKYLPYPSTTKKLRSLSSLKQIHVISSNKERQAMSIIIRIIVVALCAYAGSAVAGIQFSDLPEQHQVGLR
jgi:hypothetical protein